MKTLKNSFLATLVAVVVLSSCQNKSGKTEESVTESSEEVTTTEAPAAAPADDSAQPKFQFEVSEYDFGTVKQGEIVEKVYKFKNIGEAPLLITNAKSTCGCTIPEFPKEAVPVGGEGEIHVKFNSSGKNGNQKKPITITANTDPATTTLYLTGVVDVPEAE